MRSESKRSERQSQSRRASRRAARPNLLCLFVPYEKQVKSKKANAKINPETEPANCPFFLSPFSFFLSSVSAQKLLDVLIVRAPQALVSATEDHPPVTHHENFAVD